VRSGGFDPTTVIAKREGIDSAIDAYKAFDEHRPGWMKVELVAPAASQPAAT